MCSSKRDGGGRLLAQRQGTPRQTNHHVSWAYRHHCSNKWLGRQPCGLRAMGMMSWLKKVRGRRQAPRLVCCYRRRLTAVLRSGATTFPLGGLDRVTGASPARQSATVLPSLAATTDAAMRDTPRGGQCFRSGDIAQVHLVNGPPVGTGRGTGQWYQVWYADARMWPAA